MQLEHGFSQPVGAESEWPISLYQGGLPGSHLPHGQLPGSHGAPTKHPVQLFVDVRQSTPLLGLGVPRQVWQPSSVGLWHVSKSFQGVVAAASHPQPSSSDASRPAMAAARAAMPIAGTQQQGVTAAA